jgi:hypothetical protein
MPNTNKTTAAKSYKIDLTAAEANVLADLLYELNANLEDDGRGENTESRLVAKLAKALRS